MSLPAFHNGEDFLNQPLGDKTNRPGLFCDMNKVSRC